MSLTQCLMRAHRSPHPVRLVDRLRHASRARGVNDHDDIVRSLLKSLVVRIWLSLASLEDPFQRWYI